MPLAERWEVWARPSARGREQPGQLCGAAKSARVIPAGKQIILEAGQVNLCCWSGCSLPWDASSLQCMGRGT